MAFGAVFFNILPSFGKDQISIFSCALSVGNVAKQTTKNHEKRRRCV
jgi:hypothetical protein